MVTASYLTSIGRSIVSLRTSASGEIVDKELLDFAARMAWPSVVLIGILILGPGGVLQRIVGELARNLLQITEVVGQFKISVADFNKSQNQLKESTQWVAQLEEQILSISNRIESINKIAQELAISEGTRSIEKVVSGETVISIGSAENDGQSVTDQSAEEMFADIRERWDRLIENLKARLEPAPFDARSVGQMARKLVDGRRANPLSLSDAELIERLHSQMKRFNRLQSSKDEWLTHDIYAAFVRGVDQAYGALA